MTPSRRRELAEKWRAEYNSTNKPWQVILESAFLEIEREVREECAKVCDLIGEAHRIAVDYQAGTAFKCRDAIRGLEQSDRPVEGK